jgi:hypothetical protein
MINAAVHYANTKFQSEALPAAMVNDTRNRRPCTVKERQAALDQLAKKLAKSESGDPSGRPNDAGSASHSLRSRAVG